MKANLLALLVALPVLPGCAGVVVVDATRKESRAAIEKVMAAERPGVGGAEAAVCVQKAMTLAETVKLGTADNYKTVSAANRERILGYAARPEAVACLDALPGAQTQ